jgi:Uma2 family endonuclease
MAVAPAHRKPKSARTPAPAATVADLLKRLGVPPARVRLTPPLGTATERDLIATNEKKECLVELVDGVLVEKPTGSEESNWAALLIMHITAFVLRHDLGKVYIPDGPFRLVEGLVRLPDVAFVSWARYRKPKHRGEIPAVAPDLAVEILSRSNTKREMERKLGEYFAAGVRLAWIVDPRRREVRVHTSPADPLVLTAADVLDGGDVLPGFRLPLAEWFEQAEREGPVRR